MPEHIFFDLDNTLTPSRAAMKPEYAELFRRLCEVTDVIVVTGGAEEQIRKQIPLDPKGIFFQLSQQGNFAIHKDGRELWHESVTDEQEKVVRPFAEMLTKEYLAESGMTLRDPNDIWENRGSQFASSILGFHAPNEEKYVADPDQSIRRALLSKHSEELGKLRDVGIEAMPAGTTTFDFILTGKHKGFNITRLLRLEQWKNADCLYVGDALFPGGNDETVIGVIPTRPVKDVDETFAFVEKLLQ